MDLVDSKYIGLVSPRLEKFKRVKQGLYNFRCPICGDSQRNKNKARGYLYALKNAINFKCHNCGASMTFNNFLKKVDTNLHKQYSLDKFKEGKTGRGSDRPEPKFNFQQPNFNKSEKTETLKIELPKASDDPIARSYLERRKLNPSKFYFAENFAGFCNSYKKVFSSDTPKEPRIIIPLFYNQNLIGFQGRSLGPSKVKYITVMLDDDAPKIYGLDSIDVSQPIYIVEGPFDSTFIKNAVAMCGSDVSIGSLGWRDYIYVFDNEPRNREIVNRISKIIDRGDKIVIWPSNISEKDINDMVIAGHNVQNLIESNTYSGLEANLKFNLWKKI